MLLTPRLLGLEALTQKVRQVRVRMPANFKAGTAGRAVFREDADHHMTASCRTSSEGRSVALSIAVANEKMQHRAIVPYLVRARRIPTQKVRNNPIRLRHAIAQPRLRRHEAVRRDIEHRDIRVAAIQEAIDQP